MSIRLIMRVSVITVFAEMLVAPDLSASDVADLRINAFEYGVASWYGAKYRGRKTASGERFDPSDLTAAHPSLPMGTLVEVLRPDSGKTVVVRINDRGPGGGRVLDLSEAAARKLGLVRDGTGLVSLQVVGFAD